ncbi:SusC/RagA family TonB-linked outer membrane protein [Parafilimonas sp.]|uniref:SusC/RagA family TonB-linked outer membrane protein n=1 Tax=Parafilimonas sp. TaxID=1969739 RepID=UPI0039E24CE4
MKLLCKKRPEGRLLMIMICFLLTPVLLRAQEYRTISGKVTDSAGNPLPGITVSIQKKAAATSTDANGNYSIKAGNGDILVFSSVSFTEQQVKVGPAANYNIVMQASVSALGDVVVVGYGQTSRKNLSSSVVTVKPEDLNRAVTSDIGQLLQGKVPGLNITASGDPNASAAVVMRGASTINSPQGPFYVIDGIPGADIATIAPSDIASIDVLKDAAATAIYGNKASNGVIIITTKKGKSGRTQTSYDGYVGLEKVTGSLDVMDTTQIRNYVTSNGNTILPTDDLDANTDWMRAIERPQAISHNHNLSFSGGNEKSTYSASLNYLDKEGILLKSNLRRMIARLSLEHRALKDKLKLGLNVTNSGSKAINTPLRNVVLKQAAKYMPVSPVYEDDGTYFENFNTTGYFNPVSLINNATDETKYNTLLGNFTAEATLPWGFKYNLNAAFQRNTSLHGEYYNSYYSDYYNTGSFYNNPDPGFTTKSLLSFGENGSAYRSSYQSNSTTIESYLTWDKKIKLHSINAVLGYSWQENNSGDGLQASNTNFVSDYTSYYNLALGNYAAVSSYTVDFGSTVYQTTRFISDFFRLNYSYNNKYLMQASVRRDGSSVFGENNQWGYFPSVGLAWRIDQEGFMKNSAVISDLKLRLSYGQTGNAFGFGAYTAKQLFSSYGTYYNDGVYETAIGVTQGSNPDLKWEVTSTSNIGLDFGLFKGKVSGTLDLYEKITTNMIFDYTVSSTIVPGGYVWGNGGKVRNRGIELSLSATPVKTKNFAWNTTVNLASNQNLILDMNGPAKYGVNSDSIRYTQPDGPGQTNSTLQILKVGHAIGEFFTLKYAGKDADGNSQFLTHDGTLTTSPTIGTDYFYVGSPHPKLLLGWNNTLSYKNFDLNFFFRGAFGGKIFNVTRADLSYTPNATTNNISVHAANDLMTDAENNAYSTRYIENGSYIRLDNATFSYRLPVKDGGYITNLRFYLTSNNVFVITKYSGIDPEINQGGVGLGVDGSNFYPKTRTIVLGVNVGF